jgi:hypothetical protein
MSFISTPSDPGNENETTLGLCDAEGRERGFGTTSGSTGLSIIGDEGEERDDPRSGGGCGCVIDLRLEWDDEPVEGTSSRALEMMSEPVETGREDEDELA